MEQLTAIKGKGYYYLGSIFTATAAFMLLAVLTMELFYGRAPLTYTIAISCAGILIFLLTLFFTFRDLRSQRHQQLERRTLALLRFVISTVMLGYAFTKLRNGHMYLSYFSLDNRLNDLSEFDTVWSFYGRFSAFQMLTGFMEFIPAVMLLFRRTAFLGAVLLLPVIANVVLLNIFYHIGTFTLPLSVLLTAFDLYLLYAHKQTILNFLRKINYENTAHRRPVSGVSKLLIVLKFVPLVAVVALILLKVMRPTQPQPIHGAYELSELRYNQQLIQKDSLAPDVYRKLYFEKRHLQNSLYNGRGLQGASIRFFSGDSIKITYRNGALDMYVKEDTTAMFLGVYAFPNDSTLILTGKQNGQVLQSRYRKIPLTEYAYWWE